MVTSLKCRRPAGTDVSARGVGWIRLYTRRSTPDRRSVGFTGWGGEPILAPLSPGHGGGQEAVDEQGHPGPLAGVKILEFSEIIAAPFGGMLLSDMGAEIVKVDRRSASRGAVSAMGLREAGATSH